MKVEKEGGENIWEMKEEGGQLGRKVFLGDQNILTRKYDSGKAGAIALIDVHGRDDDDDDNDNDDNDDDKNENNNDSDIEDDEDDDDVDEKKGEPNSGDSDIYNEDGRKNKTKKQMEQE